MSKKTIAIDLGGTSIKFAIISQAGEILQKWSIHTNILDGGCHIVPDIIQSIRDRLNLYQMDEDDFLGIGLGSPGTINQVEGTIQGAYNLNWAQPQPVRRLFKEAFKLPFYMDNDANVAALGEQWLGAGESLADVVMVTLGTGVGGGIVINHQLVHGAIGAAGEIGHITIDPACDVACTCGKKGCLEAVASATGILNLARKHAMEYAGDSPIKIAIDSGEEITAKAIFQAGQAGDKFAQYVVDQFAHYLGLACSHIANILNPQRIVLGGGVSQAGEYLLDQVEAYMKAYSFKQVSESTQLKLASLGNDAGILGAGQLVNLNERGE